MIMNCKQRQLHSLCITIQYTVYKYNKCNWGDAENNNIIIVFNLKFVKLK